MKAYLPLVLLATTLILFITNNVHQLYRASLFKVYSHNTSESSSAIEAAVYGCSCCCHLGLKLERSSQTSSNALQLKKKNTVMIITVTKCFLKGNQGRTQET